jgi:protein gp37
MGISNIQWTNATINFWTGCQKISPGCKFCYMYRDKARWQQDGSIVKKVSLSTIQSTLKSLKGPSMIFTCSWSDFFIEEADAWRDEAWDIIRENPQHTWQILTKRPERIRMCLPEDWGDGWDNVWLGVSCEDQWYATTRIAILLSIPTKLRFISCEPLMEAIDLTKLRLNNILPDFYLNALNGQQYNSPFNDTAPTYPMHDGSKIDWVIIGGESGNENGPWRYRQCELEWIEKMVLDCQQAGIPVFVKQLGTYLAKFLSLHDRHGGDMEEWPEENLKVRQFPKAI